jgi:hypothetical protein
MKQRYRCAWISASNRLTFSALNAFQERQAQVRDGRYITGGSLFSERRDVVSPTAFSASEQPFRWAQWPELAGQRPSAGRHEPEISITDVSLRGPTYLKKFTRPSHLGFVAAPNRPEALPVWVRFPSPAPEFHPVRRPLATIGSSAGWRFVSRQAKRTASTSSGVIRPSPAMCSSAAAASAKTLAETFAAAP